MWIYEDDTDKNIPHPSSGTLHLQKRKGDVEGVFGFDYTGLPGGSKLGSDFICLKGQAEENSVGRK